MIEIIETTKSEAYKKAKERLSEILGKDIEILKTKNGKPFINAPLFFSITHSGNRAYIAICDSPVGIDLEIKGRNFKRILNRFTSRERAEISDSEEKFLVNWTVKEAYIKLHGHTLATHLKKLEYVGGKLYSDGEIQNINIDVKIIGDEVLTVCS